MGLGGVGWGEECMHVTVIKVPLRRTLLRPTCRAVQGSHTPRSTRAPVTMLESNVDGVRE